MAEVTELADVNVAARNAYVTSIANLEYPTHLAKSEDPQIYQFLAQSLLFTNAKAC